MKDKQIKEFYEFSSFRLDVKKRRLTHGEENIPLTPKEFGVLILLIENAGRVVEKDELLDEVWRDAFVEEGTLTRNVSWLRKKLAAHVGNHAKIIETVPKFGYRFLPEVVHSYQNPLVIQEQTIQQIEIEERIEILLPEEMSGFAALAETKALPASPAQRSVSKLWVVCGLMVLAAVIFGSYRMLYTAKQPQVLMATKTVPFSGLPGRENFPAFSPDGKQIVFSWDGNVEGGKFDIYIKMIGSGDPIRLTNTAEDEIDPVFSPDGRSIAFVREFPDHKEIVMMSALGGGERKIYDTASYASISFSPDGKLLAAAELDISTNKTGIFTIDLQSGANVRITSPESPSVDHTPRFSPDGKNIAFIRYFSSFRRELFITPTTGGDARQITSDDTRIYGMAWGADSQKLFFTSFRKVDHLNLWQISIVSKSEPALIPTGGKNLENLAVSPNGRTIAFTEGTQDDNIWELGSNARPIPLIRSISADNSPQYSPDAKQIVFASDRTGNYEVWIADADGKNQRQLTESKSSAGSPRFSPDGRNVVYDAQMAKSSDIYIVASNGGSPRRLTENAKNSALPAWSLDGQSIFFLSNRSGSDQIWKMSAAGGEAVQITKEGAFEMYVSPDGNSIIYSKGGERAGLWQIGVHGENEAPIPELSEAGGWRSWCVNDKGVYYTAFTAQPPYAVKLFDLTTRKTKEITTAEKPPLLYYSNLSVSSDGNKILYAREDNSSTTITLAELGE